MKTKAGNIQLTVLMVGLFVAILGGVLFNTIRHGLDQTQGALERTRSQYAAESMLRAVARLSQDYVAENGSMIDPGGGINSAAIEAYVTARLGSVPSANYGVSDFDISIDGIPKVEVIPNGPFEGMQALTTPLKGEIEIQGSGSFRDHAEIEANFVLATISAFQFQIFGIRSVNSVFGDDTTFDGRIHSNRHFCIGGFPFTGFKVTAADKVVHYKDVICNPAYPHPVDPSTKFSTTPTFSATLTHDLTLTNDHGCMNCEGSGLAWSDFALATWNGNVMDSAHGVKALKLPITNTVSVPKACNFTSPGTYTDNYSERLLVEPVMPSDPADVKRQKMAYKADIRIINGVWYIKDPADANNWPGLPIWSDHPGSFESTNEENIEGVKLVGQQDIRVFWQNYAGGIYAWPNTLQTPEKYSYYEYDESIASINVSAANTGVISYGSLLRNSAPLEWKPGHWIETSSSSLCTPVLPPGGTPPAPISNCTNCNTSALLNARTQLTCSNSGIAPTLAANYLNATRSGFTAPIHYTNSAGSVNIRKARARRLPVNFDIDALKQALICPAVPNGELGCYFGAGRPMGRDFNGIIYVTHTWPSQMNLNAPAEVPYSGAVSDPAQAPASHLASQQALPFPLCSADSSVLPGGRAGQSFDGSSGVFRIPNCSSSTMSRPGLLRIVNGRDLVSSFPNGLSIVSNLPVYLVGDYNATSNVSSANATPWIPALVGGDVVYVISNEWSDQNARWDIIPATQPRVVSTNVAQNLATIGYLHSFMMEDWRSRTFRFTGSSIWAHKDVIDCVAGGIIPQSDITSWSPQKIISKFDPHFLRFSMQPPGAPVYDTFAIKNFKYK